MLAASAKRVDFSLCQRLLQWFFGACCRWRCYERCQLWVVLGRVWVEFRWYIGSLALFSWLAELWDVWMTFILHGAGFSSLVLESDSKVALHLIEEASPFDPKIFCAGNCQAALSLVSGWCEADGCPHNLAPSGVSCGSGFVLLSRPLRLFGIFWPQV